MPSPANETAQAFGSVVVDSNRCAGERGVGVGVGVGGARRRSARGARLGRRDRRTGEGEDGDRPGDQGDGDGRDEGAPRADAAAGAPTAGGSGGRHDASGSGGAARRDPSGALRARPGPFASRCAGARGWAHDPYRHRRHQQHLRALRRGGGCGGQHGGLASGLSRRGPGARLRRRDRRPRCRGRARRPPRRPRRGCRLPRQPQLRARRADRSGGGCRHPDPRREAGRAVGPPTGTPRWDVPGRGAWCFSRPCAPLTTPGCPPCATSFRVSARCDGSLCATRRDRRGTTTSSRESRRTSSTRRSGQRAARSRGLSPACPRPPVRRAEVDPGRARGHRLRDRRSRQRPRRLRRIHRRRRLVEDHRHGPAERDPGRGRLARDRCRRRAPTAHRDPARSGPVRDRGRRPRQPDGGGGRASATGDRGRRHRRGPGPHRGDAAPRRRAARVPLA